MAEEKATTWGENALTELFGSGVRAAVLSHICAHPEGLIVASKLARTLDLSASVVGVELARLERLGMLVAEEAIGPARPYRLNERFPLLHGLQSVCLYATGIVAVLRELFAEAEGVEVAAIFGSLARGDDRPDSDVDVLVVGEIDGGALAEIAWEARGRTNRTVNTVHYSVAEFAQRMAQGHGFLTRVFAGPMIFLRGDLDGLRRLALAEGGKTVGRQRHSSEELKQSILSLMHDNWGYSQEDLLHLRDRWNLPRFRKHIEAPKEDIQRALDELCRDGALEAFPEVGGTCYKLPRQAV